MLKSIGLDGLMKILYLIGNIKIKKWSIHTWIHQGTTLEVCAHLERITTDYPSQDSSYIITANKYGKSAQDPHL